MRFLAGFFVILWKIENLSYYWAKEYKLKKYANLFSFNGEKSLIEIFSVANFFQINKKTLYAPILTATQIISQQKQSWEQR